MLFRRDGLGFPAKVSVVFILSTILAATILVATNWQTLQTEMLPFMDPGADELRVEQASRGTLFVGHYSRFGFSNPGPFFFYVRSIAESLFGRYFPAPYNAHVAALLCLNGIFIGLAAAAAHGLAERGRSGWLAAIAIVAAVMCQFHQSSSGLVGDWMPDVVRMPYFAFLMLLLLMARGSGMALVAATFCGAAAVHGYVAMPLFIAVPWLAAAAYGHFTLRAQGAYWSRGAVIGAAGTILIFIAPMLLDRLLHAPDNFQLILAYLRSQGDRAPNDPGVVASGLLSHWSRIQPLLWPIPVIGLLLDSTRWQRLINWVPVLALLALSTALFALYLREVADPTYDYIGYFHESVPLVLISFGAIRIAVHAAAFLPACLGMVLACAIVLSWGGGQIGFTGAPEIRLFSEAIMRATPARDIVIEIGDYGQWGIAAGVMVDLERFGRHACTPPLPFGLPDQSLTAERICGADESKSPRFSLVDQDRCWPDCIESNRFGSLVIGTPPLPIFDRGSLPWNSGSMVRLTYREADDVPVVRKLLHDLGIIGVRACNATASAGIPVEKECPEITPGDHSIIARVVRGNSCRGACLSLPQGRALAWSRSATTRDLTLQLDFSNPAARHHLGSGWSQPEPWGIWTDGDRADMIFDKDELPRQGDVEIDFDILPYVPLADGTLEVSVSVNGRSMDEWSLERRATPGRHTLFIPAAVVAERQQLTITFEGIGKSSPARDRVSGDGRRLGIALYRLAIYSDR